jgi:hypothetical protein
LLVNMLLPANVAMKVVIDPFRITGELRCRRRYKPFSSTRKTRMVSLSSSGLGQGSLRLGTANMPTFAYAFASREAESVTTRFQRIGFVSVVVVWRKWLLVRMHDFPTAVYATVDSGPSAPFPWLVQGVELFVAHVAEVCRVLV